MGLQEGNDVKVPSAEGGGGWGWAGMWMVSTPYIKKKWLIFKEEVGSLRAISWSGGN